MRWGKREDMIVHEQDPFNAETSRAALADSPLTASDAFYVRSHGPVPDIDPAAWRLRVDGLVAEPLELSLEDLHTRFDEHEATATMQCAGNRREGFLTIRDIPGEAPWGPGATGTASRRGVPLADVLAMAGLEDAARHVELVGADVSQEPDPPQAFGASLPRHKATAEEVLLAWAMNGEPLPRAHGAPVRVVVPGYSGARSVKWIERVTARAEPSENFFQVETYRLLPPEADPGSTAAGDGVPLGSIALNSDILVPAHGSEVPAGRLRVAGYALAGDDRSIVRVDLSTDAGATWRQADLLEDQGRWAWRLWEIDVEVGTGRTDLLARAWDSSAACQPEDPAHLWNPKGYVNNSWAQVSLTARE